MVIRLIYSSRYHIIIIIFFQITFCHFCGILASYMASKLSLSPWLITIVPSIANFKSQSVFCTIPITFFIRSISCRKNMFMGNRAPILCRDSFTCRRKTMITIIFVVKYNSNNVLYYSPQNLYTVLVTFLTCHRLNDRLYFL